MIYSTGSNIKVFACNSNRDLAESIAKKLGLKLGDAEVENSATAKFPLKSTKPSVALTYSSSSPLLIL